MAVHQITEYKSGYEMVRFCKKCGKEETALWGTECDENLLKEQVDRKPVKS